ncbi:hypothetical protein N7528_000741 [Penicillium herquei]|nr:hypothetical protein N7528_000741 [Penicillium herquei]
MSGEVKCVDEGDRALVMRFAIQRATALRHNDAMLNLHNNDGEDERIGSSLNSGTRLSSMSTTRDNYRNYQIRDTSSQK